MAEVRVAVLQRGETELDFPEEININNDSLISKSVYLGATDYEVGNDGSQINFSDPVNGTIPLSDVIGEEHRPLDELVHNIAEDSYDEYIYSDGRVSCITTWTSIAKTAKIREQTYQYNNSEQIEIVTTNQYDDAQNIVETLVETIDRQGGIVQSILRSLT